MFQQIEVRQRPRYFKYWGCVLNHSRVAFKTVKCKFPPKSKLEKFWNRHVISQANKNCNPWMVNVKIIFKKYFHFTWGVLNPISQSEVKFLKSSIGVLYQEVTQQKSVIWWFLYFPLMCDFYCWLIHLFALFMLLFIVCNVCYWDPIRPNNRFSSFL